MTNRINRVEKLIINLDMQQPIVCNWDTCERYSRTSHQVRLHEHEGRCNSEAAQYGRHVIMTFCSESHLDYWVACTGWNAHDLADRNRGRIWGQHSAGMKTPRSGPGPVRASEQKRQPWVGPPWMG